MLSRFEVSNFKNFKENFVFNLSDTKNFEFNCECVKNGVVNNALIYGPNGIGKSNLAFAIFDIISHLTDKQKSIEFYQNYLNAECNEDDIAEFKYTFKFDNNNVRYLYGKKSLEEIIFEELYINDIKIISYDRRDYDNNLAYINLNGTETLNKDLSQIKISVVKYIKNNAVLANGENENLLLKFFNFIDSMLLFRSLDHRLYQGFEVGSRDIIEFIIEIDKLKNFEEFLNNAGIECKLKSIEVNGKKKVVFDFGKKTIDFWEASSTGTHSLTLFYYWLQKMRDGQNKPSLVVIDEFDAFYHASLSESIVKELKGDNYQAILTTHNTSLMSNDLLRPDCYFLMYKSKIGSLSNYTDKELRKAHNIEKMYKAGAFNE